MSNESDKVKPSNDYIFKLIFGDENDKDILISFLNALFKEYDFLPYIEDIEIKNSETIKKYDEEKQGRLDIKAKIDNDTYVNIEMQTKDYSDVMDRSVYYCSRILSENTIKGSSYKYPKVIAIWIIKEQSTQDNPHYNRSNPIEIDQHFTIPGVIDKEYVKTTNKVTIIYIYLSKFKEGLYNEHIDSWLNIKPLNYKDVDSRFGQITNMRLFKDHLLFWQEHATGILSVNERTMLNDTNGNEIIVGTGDVLSRYDYISTVYGMKPQQYEAEI
jgi:predicted transposase/invertase (TIGR01784 family)